MRRAVVRYPSGQDVLCSMNPSNSGFILRADVQDLTATGVGLIIRRKVPAGAVLSIDLPDEAGDTARVLEATVTAVTAHNSAWLVTCQFTHQLTDAELQALS